MSTLALTLVLISAAMHAGWNLLGKRQAPSLAFFTLAMLAGGLLLSPLLLLDLRFMQLPASFWWIWLASGLCQAVYMAGLAWAYARGEISVLYPLARALPVLLVPAFSLIMLDRLNISTQDWFGMALILLASLLLPLMHLRDFRPSVYLTPALGFILLAALGTVGYSLLDKAAIDLMTDSGQSAVLAGTHYMILQAGAALIWMLPMVWLIPQERLVLRQLLSSSPIPFIIAGIMVLCTYGLVLVAMAFTTEVSYLVALRQASIPIGALLGIFWLKETTSPLKWGALTIMLLGLLLVALN